MYTNHTWIFSSVRINANLHVVMPKARLGRAGGPPEAGRSIWRGSSLAIARSEATRQSPLTLHSHAINKQTEKYPCYSSSINATMRSNYEHS